MEQIVQWEKIQFSLKLEESTNFSSRFRLCSVHLVSQQHSFNCNVLIFSDQVTVTFLNKIVLLPLLKQ